MERACLVRDVHREPPGYRPVGRIKGFKEFTLTLKLPAPIFSQLYQLADRCRERQRPSTSPAYTAIVGWLNDLRPGVSDSNMGVSVLV